MLFSENMIFASEFFPFEFDFLFLIVSDEIDELALVKVKGVAIFGRLFRHLVLHEATLKNA